MVTEYTAEQRAEAERLYVEHGTAEASRRTGIKAATIGSWAHRSGLASKRLETVQQGMLAWAQRREVMAGLMGGLIERVLDELADSDLSELSAKDQATVLGILTDKAQVLTGGKTGAETTVVVELRGVTGNDL